METPERRKLRLRLKKRPHSLGQSVEWKQELSLFEYATQLFWPHSLGQSVEWKLQGVLVRFQCSCGPHSLGQSVEWKPAGVAADVAADVGPTRWGNQLNGNPKVTPQPLNGVERPHSLGQSVEWKPKTKKTSNNSVHFFRPHSLGQSVEWKLTC